MLRSQNALRQTPDEGRELSFPLELNRAACEHLNGQSSVAEERPSTMSNCATTTLGGAEIARIEGRDIDAMRLYEQAIRSAHDNGFIHDEALACERASAFYRSRGFDQFADLYLRNAGRGYRLSGADDKVRRLEEMYPHLRMEEPAPGPTNTIAMPVEQLDLATVIKVSQAASRELIFEDLIETLMRTAVEQAGAERAVLILKREGGLEIAAEATMAGDAVRVQLRDDAVTVGALPLSVLQLARRTREAVILDDAAASSSFARDPDVRRRQTRSVLCLPLLNRARLIGLLYLENNLASGVFAPERIAVLQLLASLAAISLENARLYGALRDSEAQWKAVFKNNPTMDFIIDSTQTILAVNPFGAEMLGYQPEELTGLPVEILFHEEDRAKALSNKAACLEDLGQTRSWALRKLRKDGGVVWVRETGRATMIKDKPIILIVSEDITEAKRAVAALRDLQMQVAHANRLETMGQLTASIAHEVNQPIAATVTSAQSALRWLGTDPPNLERARLALDRIVRDGVRAADVVQRVRNLSKRDSPRDEPIEINATVREAVELTRTDAKKHDIAVRLHLADGLPPVRGDRVELQQVLLNLILNAKEAMSGGREPRELTIATDRTDSGDILVSVGDTGPGFSPAIQENLFKPFHTTKPNGLGLGLSICRSIIEGHGGRLWASANSPSGALFRFTLPSRLDQTSDR